MFHMQKNKQIYQPKIESDFDKYIALMKQKTRATSLELEAVSRMFKVNIMIHTRGKKLEFPLIRADGSKDDFKQQVQKIGIHEWGSVPTLHLSYHSKQMHYNSVSRQDNPGKGSITQYPIGHELKGLQAFKISKKSGSGDLSDENSSDEDSSAVTKKVNRIKSTQVQGNLKAKNLKKLKAKSSETSSSETDSSEPREKASKVKQSQKSSSEETSSESSSESEVPKKVLPVKKRALSADDAAIAKKKKKIAKSSDCSESKSSSLAPKNKSEVQKDQNKGEKSVEQLQKEINMQFSLMHGNEDQAYSCSGESSSQESSSSQNEKSQTKNQRDQSNNQGDKKPSKTKQQKKEAKNKKKKKEANKRKVQQVMLPKFAEGEYKPDVPKVQMQSFGLGEDIMNDSGPTILDKFKSQNYVEKGSEKTKQKQLKQVKIKKENLETKKDNSSANSDSSSQIKAQNLTKKQGSSSGESSSEESKKKSSKVESSSSSTSSGWQSDSASSSSDKSQEAFAKTIKRQNFEKKWVGGAVDSEVSSLPEIDPEHKKKIEEQKTSTKKIPNKRQRKKKRKQREQGSSSSDSGIPDPPNEEEAEDQIEAIQALLKSRKKKKATHESKEEAEAFIKSVNDIEHPDQTVSESSEEDSKQAKKLRTKNINSGMGMLSKQKRKERKKLMRQRIAKLRDEKLENKDSNKEQESNKSATKSVEKSAEKSQKSNRKKRREALYQDPAKFKKPEQEKPAQQEQNEEQQTYKKAKKPLSRVKRRKVEQRGQFLSRLKRQAEQDEEKLVGEDNDGNAEDYDKLYFSKSKTKNKKKRKGKSINPEPKINLKQEKVLKNNDQSKSEPKEKKKKSLKHKKDIVKQNKKAQQEQIIKITTDKKQAQKSDSDKSQDKQSDDGVDSDRAKVLLKRKEQKALKKQRKAEALRDAEFIQFVAEHAEAADKKLEQQKLKEQLQLEEQEDQSKSKKSKRKTKLTEEELEIKKVRDDKRAERMTAREDKLWEKQRERQWRIQSKVDNANNRKQPQKQKKGQPIGLVSAEQMDDYIQKRGGEGEVSLEDWNNYQQEQQEPVLGHELGDIQVPDGSEDSAVEAEFDKQVKLYAKQTQNSKKHNKGKMEADDYDAEIADENEIMDQLQENQDQQEISQSQKSSVQESNSKKDQIKIQNKEVIEDNDQKSDDQTKHQKSKIQENQAQQKERQSLKESEINSPADKKLHKEIKPQQKIEIEKSIDHEDKPKKQDNLTYIDPRLLNVAKDYESEKFIQKLRQATFNIESDRVKRHFNNEIELMEQLKGRKVSRRLGLSQYLRHSKVMKDLQQAKKENRVPQEAQLTSEITISGNQYIFNDPNKDELLKQIKDSEDKTKKEPAGQLALKNEAENHQEKKQNDMQLALREEPKQEIEDSFMKKLQAMQRDIRANKPTPFIPEKQILTSKFFRVSEGPEQSKGQELSLKNVLDDIEKQKVIIFGEITSCKEAYDFVYNIASHSLNNNLDKLHIVLEQFSFEMQYLLDDFQEGKISFSVLLSTYNEIGVEKHDILDYKNTLILAQDNPHMIKLHAGVMPRPIACIALQKGSDSLGRRQAIRLALARQYINPSETGLGTKIHFKYFNDENPGATREQFSANVMRAASIAHKVNELLFRAPQDRVLVITHSTNVCHGFGVPERLWKLGNAKKQDTLCIATIEDDQTLQQGIGPFLTQTEQQDYGAKTIADVCLMVQTREPVREDGSSKVKTGDQVLMLYVTCQNDQIADEITSKVIKEELCSFVNIYPGSDSTIWEKLLTSEDKKTQKMTAKFVNLCAQTTRPYEMTVKDKKTKTAEKIPGNHDEVLLVIKSTVKHLTKLRDHLDVVGKFVRAADLNYPPFEKNFGMGSVVEVPASVAQHIKAP